MEFNQFLTFHQMIYKLLIFENFWVLGYQSCVDVAECLNKEKLEHTQITYLWFSVSRGIQNIFFWSQNKGTLKCIL